MSKDSAATPQLAATLFFCALCDKPFSKGGLPLFSATCCFCTYKLKPIKQRHSINVTRLIAVNPKAVHGHVPAEHVTSLRSNAITVPRASSAFENGLSVSMMCHSYSEEGLSMAKIDQKQRWLLMLLLMRLLPLLHSRQS